MTFEEFYLNDELKYSMSGKTLRCILDQLPEDSKIPFAEIGYGEKDIKSKSTCNKFFDQNGNEIDLSKW